MDRRDRGYYDYGPYEGYDRNDAHYHSARNLTNEFERDFQRERGGRGEDRIKHTYHEGDMNNAYERLRREDRNYGDYSNAQRYDWDQNRYNHRDDNSDRYRNSSFWDDPRGNRDSHLNDRDRNRPQHYGTMRQGYGTSDRFNPYDKYANRGAGDPQDTYPGSGGDDRRSRYGSASGSNAGDIWGDPKRRVYRLDRYY